MTIRKQGDRGHLRTGASIMKKPNAVARATRHLATREKLLAGLVVSAIATSFAGSAMADVTTTASATYSSSANGPGPVAPPSQTGPVASSNSAHVDYSYLGACNGAPYCTFFGYADALASGDLSTGQLKAVAFTTDSLGNAAAGVSMNESLSFDAQTDSPQWIDFTYDVDGSFTGSRGQALYSLALGGIGGWSYRVLATGGSGPVSSTSDPALLRLSRFDATGMTGSFRVPKGLSSLSISLGLSVLNNADFGHTATFRFGALPTGVSYTSRSGQFLTQTGAVPEPAAWAMLVLGFGAIGSLIRPRRAVAASV